MNFNRSNLSLILLMGFLLSSGHPVIGMDTHEGPIYQLPPEILETTMSFIKKGKPAKAIKHLIQLRRVCTQWREALSDQAILRITGVNNCTDRELVTLIYQKAIRPDDCALLEFLVVLNN
jgi:hypothetical protein